MIDVVLKSGDQVPRFTVTSLDNRQVSYVKIWQRKNLLLVALPVQESGIQTNYACELARRMIPAHDTEYVITRDHVEGVPSPGVVIADRWGEIHLVAAGREVEDLPPMDELLEWLRYLQNKCPECEGESR